MKIFYVTMQFPVPAGTFVAVEIRALLRTGAEVSVLALRPKPVDYDRLTADEDLSEIPCSHNSLISTLRGLRIGLCRPSITLWLVSLILRHCFAKPTQLLRSFIILPRTLDLLAFVEQETPDVLHLFWGHYPSLLGLLIARYVKSVLVSMSLNNYDMDMRYPCSALLASKVPVVWTISAANTFDLKQIGVSPERIRVCYRGVEISRNSNTPSQKKLHRMLAVERLVPEKRTADTLKVFQKVRTRWPDATLVVLGDGPERARLIRLAAYLDISDAVCFVGHVKQREVFVHMAAAQVLLFLSQNPSERLPNAVKEAMLFRCACVVTQSKGIEELVKDRHTGFIVSKGDIETAVARINHIFAHPDRTSWMTEGAYAQIVTNFDVDILTQERIQHWARLLKRFD